MSVVRNTLIVAKFLLHTISHSLELLFVLKAQLFIHQVFLISKLSLQSCLLIFKHLCVPLFDQVTIIGKFFLSLSSHSLMAPRRTNDNLLAWSFFLMRRGPWAVRGSWFFFFIVPTAPAYMPIALHFLKLLIMQASSRSVPIWGLFPKFGTQRRRMVIGSMLAPRPSAANRCAGISFGMSIYRLG